MNDLFSINLNTCIDNRPLSHTKEAKEEKESMKNNQRNEAENVETGQQNEEFAHEFGIYFSVQESDAKAKGLKKPSSKEKKQKKDEKTEKKS